jgi:L-threonylcarbamoyladenylate synthase
MATHATTETRHLQADDRGLAAAAEILRDGGLCAFPTETVYGLGGDARSDMAVARIFEAKARPRFNPLIVHLPDIEAAVRIGTLSGAAERLASAFWPGPLTLVVPLRPGAGLSPLVTAGQDSVALRVPDLPLARRLLARAGVPVAAPSANPSGRVSPTRAEHVLDGLSGRIAAVLDGGPCPVGVESTIVGLLDGPPALLRPGGLPAEALEAALGAPLARATDPERPVAPGQLASHYAPEAPVRLNVTQPAPDELLLGFGPVDAAMNLSPSGDLTEAAANLFHALRALDTQGAARIAVSPIPMRGLGLAINDRLARAAAPRGGGGGSGAAG